jgi:hypothetical protein
MKITIGTNYSGFWPVRNSQFFFSGGAPSPIGLPDTVVMIKPRAKYRFPLAPLLIKAKKDFFYYIASLNVTSSPLYSLLAHRLLYLD